MTSLAAPRSFSNDNVAFLLHSDMSEALLLIRTVNDDELLAALPECPIARANHLRALKMLLEAEMTLERLASTLSSGPVRLGEI